MQKNRHNYKSYWHCVYELKYHLILKTKHGHKCFTETILQRLEEIIQEQCEHWEITLHEFIGEADRVHILLRLHPNVMPSRLINSLKTVSSRLLRKEFSDHLASFYQEPELWTRSYCLMTLDGGSEEVMQKFISPGSV